MDHLDASPTNEELQHAKDVITSFLIGLKNYALYPEDHSICQQSVSNAATSLDAFLKTRSDLRLDVEKERLLYKNEVVFQDQSNAESLPTILFRDGIQWLQFLEGFGLEELKGFFKILKEYKSFTEDADGDLVTALWEADFPNLRYKAVNAHWESEPVLDFSHLNAGNAEDFEDEESEEETHRSLSVVVDESDAELWKLTAEETRKLREMIEEEEKRDNLKDLLFVAFALSKDQNKNNALKFALDFFKEEFQAALLQVDFRFAFRLLSGLSQIQHLIKGKIAWGKDDFDRFFLEVSSPEVLAAISQGLESLDELDSWDLELFKQIFPLLRPNAILALGPLLSKTQSADLQQQILEIIVNMAMKDISPLIQLLESSDAFMVQKLVSAFGRLKEKIPVQVFLKMLQHSSAGVRKQAVKQLGAQTEEVIKKLFALIEDPNDSVRSLVLKKFAGFRSEVVENLLLGYLKRRRFSITDHQHFLACYRTLGKCGSYRCIPFLKDLLFNRGWFPDLGRSIHRRGAAVALITLGTQEAKEILQKASKSFLPSVRLAYRKALEVSQ